MRLDLKENIVFPFSDPSWITKTLIGVVCQIFFPVMPALMGYQLAIIRQTANGEDDKMPEFDGFSGLWVRGFKMMLMLMVLSLLPVGVTIGMITTGVMAAGGGGGGGDSAMMLVTILGGLFALLCYLVIGLLFPAMMLRYAMTDQVGAFFDISTLLADIRQGLGDYLMVVFFPIIAMFALGLLIIVTAGLGALLAYPAYALIMFIQARMIGNYYRLYFM